MDRLAGIELEGEECPDCNEQFFPADKVGNCITCGQLLHADCLDDQQRCIQCGADDFYAQHDPALCARCAKPLTDARAVPCPNCNHICHANCVTWVWGAEKNGHGHCVYCEERLFRNSGRPPLLVCTVLALLTLAVLAGTVLWILKLSGVVQLSWFWQWSAQLSFVFVCTFLVMLVISLVLGRIAESRSRK